MGNPIYQPKVMLIDFSADNGIDNYFTGRLVFVDGDLSFSSQFVVSPILYKALLKEPENETAYEKQIVESFMNNICSKMKNLYNEGMIDTMDWETQIIF